MNCWTNSLIKTHTCENWLSALPLEIEMQAKLVWNWISIDRSSACFTKVPRIGPLLWGGSSRAAYSALATPLASLLGGIFKTNFNKIKNMTFQDLKVFGGQMQDKHTYLPKRLAWSPMAWLSNRPRDLAYFIVAWISNRRCICMILLFIHIRQR